MFSIPQKLLCAKVLSIADISTHAKLLSTPSFSPATLNIFQVYDSKYYAVKNTNLYTDKPEDPRIYRALA